MDAKKIWFLDSGYNSYISAYVTKLTELGYTKPSGLVLSSLNAFVNSIQSSIGMSRCLTFNQMHAGSVEAVTVNIKDPNTYQWTAVNSPSFSEGNGCKSNGTTSYFRDNLGVNLQSINNKSVIYYISESNAVAEIVYVGGSRSTSATAVRWAQLPLSSGANGAFNHDSLDANIQSFTSNNHKGLYVFSKMAADTPVVYKDGTKTTSTLTQGTPDLTQSEYTLSYNNSTVNGNTPTTFYDNAYVALKVRFDGLTDAEELNIRTYFNTYKTAVGLP